METEKINLIYAYKEKMKELCSLQDEKNQISLLKEIVPQEWITVCDTMLSKLNTQILDSQMEILNVCTRAIRTFGIEILNEF